MTTTWNDVMPGDVIRAEDNLEWFVEDRDPDGTFVLHRVGQTVQGAPKLTTKIELRYRGQLGKALSMLQLTFDGEVIGH